MKLKFERQIINIKILPKEIFLSRSSISLPISTRAFVLFPSFWKKGRSPRGGRDADPSSSLPSRGENFRSFNAETDSRRSPCHEGRTSSPPLFPFRFIFSTTARAGFLSYRSWNDRVPFFPSPPPPPPRVPRHERVFFFLFFFFVFFVFYVMVFP